MVLKTHEAGSRPRALLLSLPGAHDVQALRGRRDADRLAGAHPVRQAVGLGRRLPLAGARVEDPEGQDARAADVDPVAHGGCTREMGLVERRAQGRQLLPDADVGVQPLELGLAVEQAHDVELPARGRDRHAGAAAQGRGSERRPLAYPWVELLVRIMRPRLVADTSDDVDHAADGRSTASVARRGHGGQQLPSPCDKVKALTDVEELSPIKTADHVHLPRGRYSRAEGPRGGHIGQRFPGARADFVAATSSARNPSIPDGVAAQHVDVRWCLLDDVRKGREHPINVGTRKCRGAEGHGNTRSGAQDPREVGHLRELLQRPPRGFRGSASQRLR
mmetsp:Transcript_51015/g.157907  ORF Transcript_51015/g.157907 Transcript_51015/m.157907 type:complete len:334 (+) Transcript_51015:263-1264(+)